MPSPLKPTLRGRRLAGALWRLVRVYWISPDAKWGALLLAGAIGLELLTVRASVLVSEAQRRIGDALELKDSASFLSAVGLFVGFALLFVLFSTYRVYLRQALEMRWRLGIAGVLLHEPDWIMLDEATSALDEPMEGRVYRLLVERLPRASLLSAALRPGAVQHLPAHWTLSDRGDGRSTLRAA